MLEYPLPSPLDVPCPTCAAPAGKRCIDLRTRRRRRPLPNPQPHATRLWPTRRCPKCKAFAGEPCRTPQGRIQPNPHAARRAPTRAEAARYAAARAAASAPPTSSSPGAPASDRENEQDPEPALAPPASAAPHREQLADGDVGEEAPEVLQGQPLAELVRPAARFTAESAALAGDAIAQLGDAMADYVARSQAPNSTRAYESDWRQFSDWTARHDLRAMPADPATCALYLTAMAEDSLTVATIRRRASAISRAHRQTGHPSPIADPGVQTVLEGIARTHGVPASKKLALRRDALLAVVDQIDPASPAGLRDRALLLCGFALALRRSELVAIRVEDLEPHPDGMLVTLARSKSDQHGRGHTFLLANGQTPEHCPVSALRAWIEHAQLTEGPIARRLSSSGRVLSPLSAQSVRLIIRRRIQAADLPGVSAEDFAGHSLRSGFATQAAADGYSPSQIRHVTRHRDPRTLDGYIHAGAGAKDLARVL